MEFYGIGRIHRMNQSVAVDREIQQERSIMPHTAIVQVDQLFRCLHPLILLRMIEPSRTNGHITLGRHPLVAVDMSILQFRIIGISRIHLPLAQERPVGGTGKAFLVAHPAASRAAVGKDNGLRLDGIEHLINTRIVIIVFPVDGTGILRPAIPAVASVGSVEPHLKHRTIVRQQVVQLRIEIRKVIGRTVVSLMTVPGRQVHRKLQSVFLTSLRQFLHHISLTVLPGRMLHAVLRAFERPQTEAIVMLGRQNHPLHAGLYQCPGPLLTVEFFRIEQFRVGISIAPFTVVESIQSKMNERISLHLLPCYLLGLRNRQNGFGSRNRLGSAGNQCRGNQ